MKLPPDASQDSIFDDTYKRLAPRVIRVFARYFPDIAEDLTHETFLRVYRNWKKQRLDCAGLESYLWFSVKNRLRDTRRNRRRRRSDLPLEDSGMGHEVVEIRLDGEPSAEAKLLNREKLALLGRLTTQQKQCMLLRIQGYSGQENAELLGISINTVKTHLRHARRELARLMEESEGPR